MQDLNRSLAFYEKALVLTERRRKTAADCLLISEAYKILVAVALAVLTRLLMRNFMTQETALMINANLFEPVRSIFINGLKMCAVPVVFFSIVTCFAGSSTDLPQMKRLGVRLFSMFELLHIISALVGIAAVWLFSTGQGANLTAVSALSSQSSLSALSSLRDVFINAMPGNLLKPFLEDNILQLMILGILTGIAANATGAKTFTLLADDLRKIFAKIVKYILNFTVLIVFCSISSAIITAGLKMLLSVIEILLMMTAAFLVLNLVLCVMITVLAYLNPLKFYKKSAHVFMVGFSIASSNAVRARARQTLTA